MHAKFHLIDIKNIESNHQLSIPSSSSSIRSYSEIPQRKKRKCANLDDNSKKEKFWTVATNAIQTISKSNENEDGLNGLRWILDIILRK